MFIKMVTILAHDLFEQMIGLTIGFIRYNSVIQYHAKDFENPCSE